MASSMRFTAASAVTFTEEQALAEDHIHSCLGLSHQRSGHPRRDLCPCVAISRNVFGKRRAATLTPFDAEGAVQALCRIDIPDEDRMESSSVVERFRRFSEQEAYQEIARQDLLGHLERLRQVLTGMSRILWNDNIKKDDGRHKELLKYLEEIDDPYGTAIERTRFQSMVRAMHIIAFTAPFDQDRFRVALADLEEELLGNTHSLTAYSNMVLEQDEQPQQQQMTLVLL